TLLASSMLCMLVAGCGGDGSGAVNSTPAPPSPPPAPPAGANTTLLGPMKSESFVNDAAQASLSYPGSASASASTATFVYDETSQSYTMTVGGASKTFGPGIIDTALTNSAETVYEAKSGNTTDSLTVTKPGTTGRFTYEYVGTAFWQSTTIGTNSGSGSLYAVAYGEPTLAAAVPHTGQGLYSIDLIGAYAGGTTVFGMTGQGQLGIDLATDRLVLGGTLLNATGAAAGNFSGYGTLNSNGTFAGTMQVDVAGTGQIAGRLYGPNGQEIGGSYYVESPQGGAVSAGAIIGRSEAAPPPATSLSSLTTVEFQNAASSRQYTSGTGTTGNVEIGLNGPAGAATVFASDYTTQLTYANLSGGTNLGTTNSNGFKNIVGAEIFNPAAPYGGYRNFSTQYVYAALIGEQNASGSFLDYLVLGINTPISALPTIGTASYSVAVDGTLANLKGASQPIEISGTGSIGINFANGQVGIGGQLGAAYQYTNVPFGGTFTGTGTLASGTTGFSTSFSSTSGATYSGTVQGQLFGPAANEVGAVFSAAGSDGSNIAGAMTGTANSSIVDPNATLASLTAPTVFATNESAYGLQGSLVESGSTQIAYDPTSKTYTVSSTSAAYNTGLPAASAVLGPSNVDSANSNATFTAYSGPNLAARIFNTGAANPVIQLSYVSFAQITQTEPNGPNGTSYPVDHFEVFGLPTSSTNAPTTGSATYSGVVYGKGYDPAVSNGDLALGGTGQLSANFGTGAMSTTLNLNATPVGGGTAQSLGSYTFTGTTSGGAFSGQTPTTTSIATGIIQGNFYGPTASEVGAAFTINLPSANGNPVGATNLAGVFLGKKN
ncbi:transferrin-binding protein-like solute binding protein, partial [Telmatospirillum sp.]|uniref:beta strand repeat-containing protein n=1 Tax=Telmatospirillum sp. TaxID=2079197 RepID=UPI00284F5163